MKKTSFKIRKMDCPAEEALIRARLEALKDIRHLDFDLAQRQLTVYHDGEITPIVKALAGLHLGESLLQSAESGKEDFAEHADQKKLLLTVLAINFAFFLIEMGSGLLSRSMGLVADSLDMLADSFVYGISLLAVGRSLIRKKRIARLAGYFQLLLALSGFAEVLRRFFLSEAPPDFQTMITVSLLALLANAYSLYLMQKSKSKEEAHMQASLIFTSNDIVINLGVIAAGLLVYALGSAWPDLIIGLLVFIVVIRGALQILKLGR